jgi:hypothetical protein
MPLHGCPGYCKVPILLPQTHEDIPTQCWVKTSEPHASNIPL